MYKINWSKAHYRHTMEKVSRISLRSLHDRVMIYTYKKLVCVPLLQPSINLLNISFIHLRCHFAALCHHSCVQPKSRPFQQPWFQSTVMQSFSSAHCRKFSHAHPNTAKEPQSLMNYISRRKKGGSQETMNHSTKRPTRVICSGDYSIYLPCKYFSALPFHYDKTTRR